MRVALIHYDVTRMANEPGVRTVIKHFGHMPNIQLLYVAAVLEQLGVEIQYNDIIGMNISDAELEEKLKAFDPDIIGLSVFTSHFHNAKSWSHYVRSFLPRVKVILGGVHNWIFPIKTMEQCPDVDYICVGEAEMVLPEFIRRWEAKESYEGLRGLVWRDGDKIQYAGPPDQCDKLDEVPFPSRHLVPNEVYFNFISTRRNYTVFNTSRGCPYRCIFCEAGGQKWRARSAANVVAEFEECYEKYNIREVDIFDSSFTVNKKRVLEICRLMIANGLSKKMVWDVRSRVDTIDEEMLEALKEGGCYRIFYGIESGNVEALKLLRKQIDKDRIRKIIKKTDDVGISPFGYFLVGSPGETPETARETIDFSKSLPLDFAIFNVLTAFPGTELYNSYYLPYVDHDFWDDYIAQPQASTEFMGRPWTKMENEELRRLAHKALLEYYFRPQQIYRAIRSVRSVEQFQRYSAAAWDMVLGYLRGDED